MSLLDDTSHGATPLFPDDLKGLKVPHIQTRHHLNEVEAVNIAAGQAWVAGLNNITPEYLFSRQFVVELHQKLFGEVWIWAGTFRQREHPFGTVPSDIETELETFLEDAKTWIEFDSHGELELIAKIHHGLVKIHPFPNGNGHHSRMFADTVRWYLQGKRPLKWANTSLNANGAERRAYIAALRKADDGDITALVDYLKVRNQ